MAKKPAPMKPTASKKTLDPFAKKIDARNIYDNPGVKTVYIGGHR